LVIGEEASDEKIATELESVDIDVLLIPYHSVKDKKTGDQRTGVSVLKYLWEKNTLGDKSRIFMPISIFGRLSFEAEIKHLPPNIHDNFSKQVCEMNEPFEDVESLKKQVKAYLERREFSEASKSE